MSTSKVDSRSQAPAKAAAQATEDAKPEIKPETKKKEKSFLDEFLKLISSVKFGISLLVLLMIFSMIGTFIVQQGTGDFAKFFQSLTPAEKHIYEGLGFFDIYHSWYFNLLLLTLSLNIILASIDRAPGHWHFFSQPKLMASESYARHQTWYNQLKLPASAYTPELIGRITNQCRKVMLPRWAAPLGALGELLGRLSSLRLRVSESKEGATTVFVERGVWNRLAFCAVHVALLMILIGWFVGNKWGQKGVATLAPGGQSDTFISPGPNDTVNNYKLPFKMVCYDIQQDLIDPSKPDISPQNTLDWHTRVKFVDGKQEYARDVHLNEPVDFRGYRFFQASFDPENSTRQITLELTPKDGQGKAIDVTIYRPGTKLEHQENNKPLELVKANTSVDVPGVGKISWGDFYPDMRNKESGDYDFPAAQVDVQLADGTSKSAMAFPAAMSKAIEQAPMLKDKNIVGNYAVVLKDFEKVSRAHTLQIQYDPGVDTIYLGCALLVLCLISVFFFSHERIWVFIKPGQNELNLYFAGNTNRNRPSFENRYNRLLAQFMQGAKEVSGHKPQKESLQKDRSEKEKIDD
jgi:cytochrome c biogenesis protein